MIVSGRHDMTNPPSEEARRQLRLRYRLGAHIADEYHAAGFAVVVQDVVIGPALRAYVDAIGARPLVVAVLAPSAEVVARREAGREKVAYRADAGAYEIAALDAALRHGTPRIGLWLDTSDDTPDQTVDTIVRRALAEGTVR
jgi:hypothetical protein